MTKQQIETQIYEIHCKGEFAEIKAEQSTMNDKIDSGQVRIYDKIDEVHKILVGNGKEGLITKRAKDRKDIDYLIRANRCLAGVATVIASGIGIRMIWNFITHVQK